MLCLPHVPAVSDNLAGAFLNHVQGILLVLYIGVGQAVQLFILRCEYFFGRSHSVFDLHCAASFRFPSCGNDRFRFFCLLDAGRGKKVAYTLQHYSHLEKRRQVRVEFSGK